MPWSSNGLVVIGEGMMHSPDDDSGFFEKNQNLNSLVDNIVLVLYSYGPELFRLFVVLF